MRHFILFAALFLLPSASFAREMALTFDDCPRKAGPVLDPMTRDQRIVEALMTEGVTAAFFCNSPAREPNGIERIRFLADHGHLIANHTADHPDLNKSSVAAYVANIDRADAELKTTKNFRKWFRFPFLREGKNARDVEAIRSHLKRIGYTNGYVTVNTEDWFVDELLRQKVAARKSYDESKLCQVYARMIADEAQFYDQMSVRALGRSAKHVILLHETDLNALCLLSVLAELKKQKWAFISPDEAYRDPIAFKEPRSSTQLNLGRVFALAKEAGDRGPFFSPWLEEDAMAAELVREKVWR